MQTDEEYFANRIATVEDIIRDMKEAWSRGSALDDGFAKTLAQRKRELDDLRFKHAVIVRLGDKPARGNWHRPPSP